MIDGARKNVTAAALAALLTLIVAGPAEAIPPPDLVRIGSVFVQALAVAVVFLSTGFFFMRRQLGRMFAAMRTPRGIGVTVAAAILLAGLLWSAAALYAGRHNRALLAAAAPAGKTATVDNGVMTVAGMQFDITDPSLAMTPREAAKLLGAATHLFIDIREPVEFATRRAPGFINIRAGDLLSGEGYRQLDQGRTVVLLCEAGERGSAIAAFLRLRGYRATFIDKGIRGWIDDKQPLIGNAEMQLPNFPNKYAKVTAEEAKTRMAAGRAVLVDVRSPAEFARGHVAGAINLPLVNLSTGELEQALALLPKDKVAIGIAYDRFGAYYCLIVGWLIDQRQMKYGGTLMLPPPEQAL